ncbi:MAG: RloB domain-containing protein [Bacteroidales bacterium]|nr:RloB domain-containing protein [Bacteroidales bacterium]
MPANRIKLEPALERRYARQAQRRKQRQIVCKILIVCEGTKTEPNYFEAFGTYNRGTVVYDVDVKGLGANTLNVVDKAIELKDNGEYDRVWAVFDKDSFSNDKFNSAIIKAESNNICCAWSNEAFELWYLYHFVNRTTGMNREEYKVTISNAVNSSPKYKAKKKYVYAKNDANNYQIMTKYGSMENAIKFAEAQSEEYTDKRYAKHNPCTMVFKLVRQLIGKDEELNEELKKKVENK